jgi:hypothetical protein
MSDSVQVDMLFMGMHGADAKAGLTTPSLMEAETNRPSPTRPAIWSCSFITDDRLPAPVNGGDDQ